MRLVGCGWVRLELDVNQPGPGVPVPKHYKNWKILGIYT